MKKANFLKFTQHFSFALFCACILLCAICSPVAAETLINAADYASLTQALEALPQDAGDTVIFLHAGSVPEKDAELSLPLDRGITSLTLSAEEKNASISGLYAIYANGIPLRIESGLDLPDTSLYGGALADGTEITLQESDITIAGAAGFVFGGGFASNGGCSSVSSASVSVEEGGLVYYEVFGGGHAAGEGSRASVENTTVNFAGTSDYVLGGSYAESGAEAECGHAEVHAAKSADIEVALFAGGSAQEAGSLSTTKNALAVLDGYAHWAFSGSFAFAEGQAVLSGAGRLEISTDGQAEAAYLGGYAGDAGSSESINTAELMSCGSTANIILHGQSSDGGETKTTYTAHFPCEE